MRRECDVRDHRPKVFQLNDNRQSETVNPEGDSVGKIVKAAENRPVSAIFMEDAETGQRLFPQLSPTHSKRLGGPAPIVPGNVRCRHGCLSVRPVI